MTYEIIWPNGRFASGQQIQVDESVLDAAFNQSKQHIGTMTDLLAERIGVTRGDASRIVGAYFERFD